MSVKKIQQQKMGMDSFDRLAQKQGADALSRIQKDMDTLNNNKACQLNINHTSNPSSNPKPK